MPASATVSGVTIASADSFEVIEGNVYFPPASINKDNVVLTPTKHTSHCPWKGEASYYDVSVDGGKTKLSNAAWYYPAPMSKAEHIKDYVAFCKLWQSPSYVH